MNILSRIFKKIILIIHLCYLLKSQMDKDSVESLEQHLDLLIETSRQLGILEFSHLLQSSILTGDY